MTLTVGNAAALEAGGDSSAMRSAPPRIMDKTVQNNVAVRMEGPATTYQGSVTVLLATQGHSVRIAVLKGSMERNAFLSVVVRMEAPAIPPLANAIALLAGQ